MEASKKGKQKNARQRLKSRVFLLIIDEQFGLVLQLVRTK